MLIGPSYAIIPLMKKTGFVWKIYFFVFSFIIIKNAVGILTPGSFLYLYYHTLIAFHPSYWIFYILAIIQVFFNIVGLFQLFLFVFRICLLTPRFWQWMLALRIIFDVTGHSAELKTLIAVFYNSQEIFLSAVALIALVGIPSYGACFQYAFRWGEFFQREVDANSRA